MKRLLFLILLFLIFSSGAPQRAVASEIRFLPGGEAALQLLKKEIARDREIITHKMNKTRMKQTRTQLARDLPAKERLIDQLKGGSGSGREQVVRLIAILEETATAERAILERGTTHRLRRSAQGVISSNISRKETAVALLEE